MEETGTLEEALKNERSKMAAISIATFILAFVIAFIAIYTMEHRSSTQQLEQLKESEKLIVELENDYLGEEFAGAIGDLLYLKETFRPALLSNSNLDKIAKRWQMFSTSRGAYDQIRYIDQEGNEKIRVNYSNNLGYIVLQQLLQNKSDRYYYYQTASLGKDHVLISPLDLNVENGEVEKPIKPVIRLSIPIYDDDNRYRGILILNYLADKALRTFKRVGDNSVGDIFLLNEESYWLVGNKEHDAWNFMFKDKKDDTFKKAYPQAWEHLQKNDRQVVLNEGLFTFSNVDLYSKLKHNNDYYRDKIHFASGEWHIVSYIKKQGEFTQLFNTTFLASVGSVLYHHAVLFFFITLASIAAGMAMYLRRRSFLRIKYYSEFDPLTGVYNRRAGIEKLNEIVPNEERRERSISVCFLDVNGLKLVNDNLGHEKGDELILSVVQGVKNVIRADDVLIRLGGDEFLIVFVGIDETISERVWLRIQDQYQQINENENRDYVVSVSHGIVSHKYLRQNLIDDLIKEADAKMYSEKQKIKQDLQILRVPVTVKDDR